MSGNRAFLLLLSVAGTISLLAAAAAADPGGGNGKIAFAGDGRIYIVDPGGGNETDLGPGALPIWSPDGTRLAFLEGGIGLMNADGTGRRSLYSGRARRPVWSPDGSRLAFVAETDTNVASLRIADVATGEVRVLVPGGVQASWAPSWSPDGTQLAYTEGTAVDVAAIGGDGNGHRLVASGPGFDAAPAWSPDGTQIAFLHAAPGAVPALHLVAAAGGPLRRLTATEIAYGFQPPAPAWSPDGTRIAFTATQIVSYTRYGPIVSSAVHVIDAEGTLERRLTRALATPGFESSSWSPDGRRILFQAVGGGPAYFMNTDGTCESRVSERPGGPASWQPVSGPPSPYLRCADLDVSVLHDHAAVAAGGAETFRIAVKNLENEPATGVRLASAALERGSLESASTERGSCSLDGGSLSCDLGQLPVGEAALVTVAIRAAGVGVVSATVQASANEPDGARENNGARLTFEAVSCGLVAREDGDVLVGTFGPDRICGRSGQDVIYALGGNDLIDAGPQADRVFPGPGRDSVFLRAGADFADSRDGQRDTIVCGGERDLVLIDRLDKTSKDCEHVERPRIHRCKQVGTVRSDELVGTSVADEVCALSGNDEIHTLAGNDAVDAGSGNDTVDVGEGRDVLLAGEGYDTIFARDGARDRIRCGPQDDLVFADRHDLVTADCERVRRR